MNNLKDIAQAIDADISSISEEILHKEITSLVLDNRQVTKGSLFLALKGLNFDARSKLQDVEAQGAIAAIYEDTADFTPPKLNIPLIPCQNLVVKQADIASTFYDEPSKKLNLIGVTGTNGKSTITQLCAQWGMLLNYKTGVLGTIGNGFYPNLKPSPNTTLQAAMLEHELYDMWQSGAQAVAMEVSSHGLALGRVKNLTFKYAAFTNLTRDHLDFHKTMENYAKAKFTLFEMVPSNNAVINIDDAIGLEFFKKLPNALAYSKHPQQIANSIYATQIDYHKSGIDISVSGCFGDAVLRTKLIGGFNVENIMCALAIMLKQGFSLQELARTSMFLKPVFGRMQCFTAEDKPMIIVDYAHTPDGLFNALQAIKEHNFGKVTCICGCGGDRDTGKRPLMAKVACENAAHVIFTDDNPRTENPNDIIQMMLDGIPNMNNYEVIQPREEAIMAAFKQSSKNDVILLAGKGHEDYQIIGHVKHHFSDCEIAQELVNGDRTC